MNAFQNDWTLLRALVTPGTGIDSQNRQIAPLGRAMTTFRCIALAAALVATGCGGGKTAAPESATALSMPAVTTTVIGTPTPMVTKATDKSGAAVENAPLTWTTADPTVATVSAQGIVTPLRAGFTTVTATTNGISASGTISVRGATPIPVRSQYVGMNLGGIAYYSPQFPFADMMKSGMGWNSREDSGAWGKAFPSMTLDGYPASLSPGQHALTAVAWSGSHFAAGRYVVLWDGDGTISFPLSNVTIAETAANRIALDVTDTTGSLWVGIDRTSSTNPVHNIRFLWPGTETTYLTQPFNPAFLSKIAPFSLLRFMDWGATNGSPVVEWADRGHVTDLTYATPAGVPIETMIDLANTLHVDPWFNIPHMASDDYVKQFATLLHARLDPALHPHIEYSNEVWNWGFPQAAYANAQSKVLGLDSPWGQPAIYYATRAVQMFNIMQTVYGPTDSGRLVRVLAGQAAWDNFLSAMLAYKDTAANADVMAIAPYFGAPSADDPTQVATSLTLTSDQVVDQMLGDIRGNVKTVMTANAALAKKYNLKLNAYESGGGDTSYNFPAANVDAMTSLFIAAHNNPRMKDAYVEYYGQWVAAGGDTMNQFNDIGGWSKWGLWGSMQYVTQDPATAPKYQGLLSFIAAHPAEK